MEYLSQLKTTARQIIELTTTLGDRVQTWDEQKSTPAGGYKDRAGFIVMDDAELYADVFAADDQPVGMFRARLAWAPKNDADSALTIITLDFNAPKELVVPLLGRAEYVNQDELINVLSDGATLPKIIHVSYETNVDEQGKPTGTRYEYSYEVFQKLSEGEVSKFFSTLNSAYEHILANI